MTKPPAAPKHWIFLRGLARESGHWLDFVNACEQQLSWQCHPLDLPGFGSEYLQRSPLTVSAIRRALQCQLKLPAHEPLGIVALSLGGMVALDWLDAEPQRFSHAILINASTADCPAWQRLKISALPLLLRSLCAGRPATREQAILNMVSNCQADQPSVLAQHCSLYRRRPPTRRNVLCQLWAAAHFKAPAALAAHQQISLIASRGDRMVSWRCSAKLAKHYDGALYLHNSAGHDLPLDAGQWLIQQFKHCCR